MCAQPSWLSAAAARVRRARRSWKPNVQNKRFFSDMLQRFLKFRMTTSVIKEVKRMPGGIDQYLLTTRNELLLYPKAIQLKRNLRSALRFRARDEAIASLELAESGAAGEAGAAAASSPLDGYTIPSLPYKVPGLWQHDFGGSIGFPWKYGKRHNAELQAKRATMGHAWRR